MSNNWERGSWLHGISPINVSMVTLYFFFAISDTILLWHCSFTSSRNPNTAHPPFREEWGAATHKKHVVGSPPRPLVIAPPTKTAVSNHDLFPRLMDSIFTFKTTCDATHNICKRKKASRPSLSLPPSQNKIKKKNCRLNKTWEETR